MSAPLDHAAVLRRAKAVLADPGSRTVSRELAEQLVTLVAQAPQLSEEEREFVESERKLLGYTIDGKGLSRRWLAIVDRHFPPSPEDPT